MKRARSSYLLVVFLSVNFLAAQEHPNVERGLATDRLYQFGNIDQINTFNGNVSLRIPIGPPLPVSDRLTYALTLTYNSKVWDGETITLTDGNRTQAQHRSPCRLCNAGLGWTLTLGTLVDYNDTELRGSNKGWQYGSPDGSTHALGGPEHGSGSYGYSNDNTYLRRQSSGANELVEFPDGTAQEFEPYSVGGIQRWRLHQIR